MRAYSTDLKERLVRAVASGQPMREAARRFEVAVTTVKRAVVQQRETGSRARKPNSGSSPRDWPYARDRAAGAARSGSRRARFGALRLVGGTPRAAGQRSDDGACATALGLDA